PERSAGKRDGDPPGPALALATPETRDHTERQEIPGRMVERLARKRPRTLRFRRAAALLGNPTHHLHEAVEAATVSPGTRRAICGEPADDQPRPQSGERPGGVAQTAERARPVAVHDDVGGADEALEDGPITRRPQVERRASL